MYAKEESELILIQFDLPTSPQKILEGKMCKKNLWNYIRLTAIILFIFNSINPSLVHAEGLHAPLPWTLSFDSPLYQINTLEVYNGYLYAGGFDLSQTDGHLYRFDGTTWSDLNLAAEIGVTVDVVESLQVFNNRLYIGMRVNIAGVYYVRAYYYDGTTFTLDLSRNGAAGYSGIEALTIHNGSLFAANGSTVGEVYQRLGDGNWITVGSSIEAGSPARSLASYNGSLFAGTGASGDHARVWRWDGATWILSADFQTDFGTTKDGVQNLAVSNGMLFAGTTGPGATGYIFSYDGTSWDNSFNLLGCVRTTVTNVNGNIWAGFVQPGAATCYGQVHQLVGNTWEDMGNLGDGAQSDFTDFANYNNFIFGSTVGSGKIYYASSDITPPTVISNSLISSYTASPPANFAITFSESVYNPSNGNLQDSVTNRENYLIVEEGSNGIFDTTSCATGVSVNDVRVPVSNVVYVPNTSIVNLGRQLKNGDYRLFVCGTTSIVDPSFNTLAGNNITSGTDYIFNFSVNIPAESSVSSLPKTGFTPQKTTYLPDQPADLNLAGNSHS
jgi:hypothetical protein